MTRADRCAKAARPPRTSRPARSSTAPARIRAEASAPPPLTPPALVALAEATGTLVGETEVCSASDKMIARFLDGLVAGVPAGGIAAVDRLIAARDRVLGFGACYAAFKLA